jgi:Tol biopolymer transport system component
MDRSGKLLGLLADAAAYADVQLSPDDQWVSATKTSPAGAEIWLVDVARNLSRRFTFGGAGGFSAVWAPGPGPRRLAYASRRGKNADLFLKAIDGTGVEEPLLRDSSEKVSVGFSADGRFLLYNVPSGAARGRLWLLPLADRRPRPLISEPTEQASAEISPDGRWIAYVLVDESSRRVYVASFPDVTGQREISPDGGETPRWRQDGKELFFTNAGKLMAVDIQGAGATIDVGAPHVLFDVAVPAQGLGTRATFAVSRDGQRFLFNTWDAQASLSPIVLIVNWPRTLDRSPAHSPALRH